MALKGLDIFKLTPKTNCKECGNATCMAFSMKVAQGAIELSKCPHLSDEALAALGDATAPPMKKITLGADNNVTLGGETVLFRHDKTFVSKSLYAVSVCADCYDKQLPDIKSVDYDRLGERMYVELLNLKYELTAGSGDKDAYVALAKKAVDSERTLILECNDPDAARAALEVCASSKPLLNGANAENYEKMNALASEFGVCLGVSGADLDELYDTVAALEKLGNKNLVLDVGCISVKDAFSGAVQIRRAALKGNNRTFGYPSLVNVGKLAPDNQYMQTALTTLFTLKYGSIIVMEDMTYPQALPIYGMRQNIFTDPQKPMKVEPGIYPLNGADENSVCVTTVDFALTYFVVTGELERSGVPMNLLISDAGGYSVLTAWAAGKLSASSLAKFFKEYEIESKIKSRTLVIPGKVAVLKGEIEESLPGWKIVVAPGEAIEAVKFFKETVF
ncbi:MAG: acetyl-CoA decarbonylase/synthase complex subunit gamma [Oscillospiraceae bacterium]|jgi:acetyl-CoA decarbonylase/synthase complex subunit gamma|nr:acetyl-CoA decarbonylase/synthase complex subunit gamma [Oscillospiraceae bacterium]